MTTMGEKATRVLYLDLDGTVRHGFDELGRFVNHHSDVRVFDEVPELIARYKARGWRVAGVSNQGGIALGHVTQTDVSQAMLETNRQCRRLFDQIAWCSHHPAAKSQEMAVCWCRKPRAGLIFDVAHKMAEIFGEYYPPHLGLMVGDRDEDMACANAAAVPFMLAKDWRGGAHSLEEAQ